ncbi:GGDEF-domain containing protein [Desulfobacter hydrogenophilus]|uniref:EAL domain-containing protein n=1 Tax=Desulfobacter hydrogenophilus TaxID=2291 RepID=A0A328FAQ5_9BACT|nr:EAL domain-containing protein [Desulfobacter hydrogenophilus]NDY72689.1 EAL domain-containing protein [Desulfobacter hydrogenophilus]QBH14494.1 EAL domain-containing protein [Desulfobacter hydrogenophilus]RAM01449.1 GGDEF-domain containing protein [Desulfobacter hydrogenophilus]
MDKLRRSLRSNVKLMKSEITRYALFGTLIAFGAVILATAINAHLQSGQITFETLIKAQQTNVTLWFMDAMPFIFAFWGQYTSTIMAYEASSMVMDQTADLRNLNVKLEHKAVHDATHDALTGLPNRALLYDRLNHAIQIASRRKAGLVMMLLNLDEFKQINETLGHYSGDQLLCQVVSRLQIIIRKSDTLARVGGDEFAILLDMSTHREMVLNIVKKLQKIFMEPFSIEGLNIEVMASIGIASFPDHGSEADAIMQRASLALVNAKQNTKRFAVYNKEMEKGSPRHITMMGELRHAIDTSELMVYYQPKVNLGQARVSSVEALVRWQHPEHGFLSPDEFIPMAERTGLIRPLTIWVLNTALKQGEQWYKKGLKIGVAVNLSPAALLDTELPNVIVGMLSLYEIPARYIALEVTEGSMIKDPDLALKILNRLAELGIKISIDDFGTGYSSLAYLKKLPAKELKIDKSFVIDMLESESDAVIVKSIIDLGHNLSMKVVAEGVENKETAMKLKALGCDILQGFYFSKALDHEALIHWLGKNGDPTSHLYAL